VNPKDALVPRVESALQALESAGVSPDDRETFAKRRAKVTLDFHRELMDAVNQKFNDFYKSFATSTNYASNFEKTFGITTNDFYVKLTPYLAEMARTELR
jgi:hypothetical protein